MYVAVLALRASFHHPRQPGIDGQIVPTLAMPKRPVCLVEWLLRQEQRAVEFALQSLLEAGVLGSELGHQVLAILINYVVKCDDWMKTHILTRPQQFLVDLRIAGVFRWPGRRQTAPA